MSPPTALGGEEPGTAWASGLGDKRESGQGRAAELGCFGENWAERGKGVPTYRAMGVML